VSTFDPYHVWLGIPPKEQPPDHYRLLGVQRFEANPDVIANAADQRMAHLRTFQTGKHSADSQRLLNEVAAARLCLLSAEKKAAYDGRLRRQLDDDTPLPPIPPPPPPATSDPPSAASDDAELANLFVSLSRPHTTPPDAAPQHAHPSAAHTKPAGPGKRRVPLWLPIAAGSAGVLLVAILISMLGPSNQRRSARPSSSQNPQTPTATRPADPSPSSVQSDPTKLSRIALEWPEPDRQSATLFLDGRKHPLPTDPVCNTPSVVLIDVTPGEHRVSIRRDGFKPWEKAITFTAGTRLRVAPDLELDTPGDDGRGLLAEYFAGDDFSNKVLTRIDPRIHFLWDRDPPHADVPADHFKVRWTGYIKTPRPGRYRLAADADDRLTVTIDDKTVFDAEHGDASGEVDLTDRPHPIIVEYGDWDLEAYTVLAWSLPGIFAQQAVPAEAFFHDVTVAEKTIVPESVMRRVPDDGDSASTPSKIVDLLATVDPIRDARRGFWWFDGDTLLCSRRLKHGGDAKKSILVLPFRPSVYDYRLTIVVEQCVNWDVFDVGLATPRGFPCLGIDYNPHDGWLNALYGIPEPRNIGHGRQFTRGDAHTVICTVGAGGIDTTFDGKPLQNWRGSTDQLPEHAPFGLPAGRLFLASWDTVFRIRKLSWEPLTPSRHVAGPAPSAPPSQAQPGTPPILHVLPEHGGMVSDLKFSPDGRTLASAAEGENFVRLWDVPRGTQVQALRPPTDMPAHYLAFSPNGRYLAASQFAAYVVCWDLKTGVIVFNNARPALRMQAGPVFTSDSQCLVVPSSVSIPEDPHHPQANPPGWDQPGLQVWAVSSGKQVAAIPIQRPESVDLHLGQPVMSPNGRVVAVPVHYGEKGYIIHVIALAAKREIDRLLLSEDKEERSIPRVLFSPDGKEIIFGGIAVRRWTPQGRFPPTLLAPSGRGSSNRKEPVFLAGDSNLSTLVSRDYSGVTSVWDRSQGYERLVHRWQWQIGNQNFAVSPDGTRLALASAGGKVIQIYDLSQETSGHATPVIVPNDNPQGTRL
jgi:WD40 repeat protein